jgi:ligand-binding sensor domain-containing protein/signal transduction histidine kinase
VACGIGEDLSLKILKRSKFALITASTLNMKKLNLNCIITIQRLFSLIICFLLLIFIASPKDLFAQKEEINFEYITVTDGLSQNSVTCIYQDQQGYMWFGTRDGLNRYDGYKLELYYYDALDSTSLSNSSIASIYQDKYGVLWIGTNGGLNRYNPVKNNFTRYSCPPVNSIIESNGPLKKYLIIGTGRGLYIFDREKNILFNIELDQKCIEKPGYNLINTVFEDNNKSLWIGTMVGGLLKLSFNSNGGIEIQRYEHDPENSRSLSHNNISSIIESQQGQDTFLLVGTHSGGISRLNLNNKKREIEFIHYKYNQANSNSLFSNNIQTIYEDKKGNIWCGIRNGGLVKMEFIEDKVKFIQYKHNPKILTSLNNNNVITIYEDKTGILWIGTQGGGVNKIVHGGLQFNHLKHKKISNISPSDNCVWSLYEDRHGTFWVGTNKGLCVIDQDSVQRKKIVYKDVIDIKNKGIDFSVRAISQKPNSDENKLWIGTLGGGLFIYDIDKKEFIQYTRDPEKTGGLDFEKVYDVHIDKQGDIWLGSIGCGLSRMSYNDRGEVEFINYKYNSINPQEKSRWVITIFESALSDENVLWLGTWGEGLIKFTKRTGKFTYYRSSASNPYSLNNNSIFSICESIKGQQGMLWIGTNGGGLNKFNIKEGKFYSYTTRDGLPNNVIYGILEDNYGNLWLSTNKGISKFNPYSETFCNYDITDGLQSNEFNLGAYFKNEKGELLFGGINGFNSFNPKDIINVNPPEIVLTGINIFGEKLILREPLYKIKNIDLSYEQNFISFEFVGLHYKNPRKNTYSYIMEGLDKDWIYAGAKRQANYTNLEPGEYTFRVKAANSDGVWNEKGIALNILIHPPYWRTWWFLSLSTVGLFLMVFNFYRNRVKQALQIERSKNEEREEIKKQIAADFHDELGHRVTKISLASKILKANLPNSSHNIVTEVDKICDNADSLFTEMRNFIWELDPEKDSAYELAVQLKSFSDQMFDDTNIAFQLKTVSYNLDKIILPIEWRRHLVGIFKEGMHNILKHCAKCKNVILEIGEKKDVLEIILTDDGEGFNTSVVSKGNGLKNMRERAEIINGNLNIISGNISGTKIHFRGKLP